MIELTFTARSKNGTEEYRDLAEYGLEVQVATVTGIGTETDPNVWKITITAKEDFEGVIRIAMPVSEAEPRFYLPGVIYGTNRGEAPLLVDSKCPRLRKKTEFPASPWWMVRSDRMSHPCAFSYGEGRLKGFAATPYYIKDEAGCSEWEPGKEGGFYQYTGFGCSLTEAEVWYTLGYENAPWFFVESHDCRERAPMDENCLVLEKGASIGVTLYCFDVPAEDERALHGPLKWVYDKYHELPRKMCSVQETVSDMAVAIARDAWLSKEHSYSCFVFDKEEQFTYNKLPSISWTNGLAAAVPMLMSAHRLQKEEIRQQALDCISHIVNTSINERNDLPFTSEQEEGWCNRGWWYDKQPVPGHASYLVGQSVYLLLKAYTWELREKGIGHEDWLSYAKRVLERTEKSRNADGEYPYIFSERTGAGLDYDSFSGAWCLAAAAYYCYLTGEQKNLDDLLLSEAYYHDMYVRHQECYGGPLDIDKNMDSEGILAYIRAVRYLHEITGNEKLLTHLKDALYYEFTFKYSYNSPIKVPPLSEVGWSSCGGSITSVVNPHIHPMSSSVMDEMCYYLSKREDAYVESRLKDTMLWSCQCHMNRDKEYGYGRKGWMSERFCHSEGLLKERYPDGSAASTWFALMPWACGSILEGLTGEVWEKEV